MKRRTKQTMIRDRNPVRVAAQIAQYLQRSSKGGLNVHDPVLTPQTSEQFGKLFPLAEYARGSGAAELLFLVEAFESIDELAAKDPFESFHRQKESMAGTHPMLVIRGEPSGWDDAMNMRMEAPALTMP